MDEMKTLTYNVIYEGDDERGWSAFVPDLPGVAAAGDTRDETRELMHRAIELHINGMLEDGIAIPEPTPTFVEPMSVDAAA
ncbi:MAG: hypothetical protein QOI11_3840 [Candidatus Eremiobacteraeota bacterium]|jgi:predicted RNase H-like HicB family nuclease|nr:hypothetical protein [Candidatus Eremiobacteraeota bacterium]